MLVLQLIVGASMLYAVKAFDNQAAERFGYRFFTRANFVMLALAAAALYYGGAWRRSAEELGGDQLNGILLMLVGIAVASRTAYYNYRRTNWQFAVIGTSLQLALLPLAAQLGLAALALWALAWLVLHATARPVYVVNH